MKTGYLTLLLLVMSLTGCAMTEKQTRIQQLPSLHLFDYFAGKTRAWGMVQGRNGELKRQFTVDIDGRVEGDQLILTEDFVYSDGEVSRRVWRIQRIDDNSFRGEADDVVGEARGESNANGLRWQYVLRVPYGNGTIDLDFDDRMYLQPDGVLLNSATLRKFGFKVGQVTLVFRKVSI